jgi:5'-3' exonuclease
LWVDPEAWFAVAPPRNSRSDDRTGSDRLRSDRRRIHLLDVSFFTFRAYHALPPLSTAAGVPTNAIHGVAQMLERLFRTEKPQYVAACFDALGPGFRHEMYPDYKANRVEPDRS